MSDDSSTTFRSDGISTAGLLGVLFVGLKLTGYITWPWLWVLSPFWLPIAVALAVALGILAVGGLIVLIGALIGLFSK